MRFDLDAIKARAEAATPGPWRQEPDTFAGRVWVQRCAGGRWFNSKQADCEPLFAVRGGDAYKQREADAGFIAHARTDVPELVAEVERLREELAGVRVANEIISKTLSDMAR